MTVWRKVENEDCYAVAIYNYTGRVDKPHLELEVGELVHIERETPHWYWGQSLRRDARGAFPKSYVAITPCTVERCGESVLASAGGNAITHDIALTLREWLEHWKQLYLNNSDERYKFIDVSMRTLLELRAQLGTGALSQDQLRRLARTAVYTQDKGNRVLGLEISMRTSDGKLVNPLTMSSFKLCGLYDEAIKRIDRPVEATSRIGLEGRAYTAVVKVHNWVCRGWEACELQLALHDAAGNKLTEHALLQSNRITSYTQLCLFTDLGSNIKREKDKKVYLVCQVVKAGSMDTQNGDKRRSSMSVATSPPPGAGGGVRRAGGMAAADVSKHLQNDSLDKQILLPFYPCEKENMESLLRKVIANRDLKDVKHSQGLWVSMQLVEGDIKQIREENPHIIVGSTCVARNMGFPEVILPDHHRNDLYVTILGGSFSKGGGKSTERNVELTARVHDRYGNIIPKVISIGAGVPLVDEFVSVVYYHDDRPRWNEVFKVCLDLEEFKGAHVVFLLKHRSSNEAKDRAEKYFALSYLRLMQREGTTTPDKIHTLCVYKIDHKRSPQSDIETEAASSCLGLPQHRAALPAGAEAGLTRGPLALLPRDSCTIQTRLASTKLTQREEILGVLKWSTHHAEGTLRDALKKLLLVPNEELVKFLQDILDALFNILTRVDETESTYSDDSYGILVLECLMRVILLVSDYEYRHFQPVLHAYIDNSFCDAQAYEKLISIMIWVILSAEQSELAFKRLLQCMKCLESLIRIIVRSRQLRRALNADDDHNFAFLFENLMEGLVRLMRLGDPALTCQGSALKYLPPAVPCALAVCHHTQLTVLICRWLEALPYSRLSKQRMLALLELVRGPLAETPPCRSILVPHLATTLAHMLREHTELDHKSRSVDKAARLLGADTQRLQAHAQRQQIVELCIDTLGELYTMMYRNDIGPVEQDQIELARRLMPTLLHFVAAMFKEREGSGHDDPLLRRTVSVILDMVRQTTKEVYSTLVVHLEQDFGIGTVMSDALSLCVCLLNYPIFTAQAALVVHHHTSVLLHALELLSTTLRDHLQTLDEADIDRRQSIFSLLRQWFEATCKLSCYPELQLEKLTTARKQRAISLYGDLRENAASLLQNMWFDLGEHKRAFLPTLVGPFLEVSFIQNDEVRNTMIPLFFDMMQTEYNYSVANGEHGNLKELETELIDKIDVLAEVGCGDSQWRAKFVSLCGALCGAAPAALRAPAAALVAVCARQLDTLLHYRAAAQRAQLAHRMALAVAVLYFYSHIDHPHMYIRYVHKLADMHKSAKQWAEAGLALRLHATLLAWTNTPLPARLKHTHTYDTHRELKEALYLEIAELLNNGHQWELAVDVIKELVTVYEEEALGYGPLADLHSQLAKLYVCMLTTTRSHPGYFRVIYYGKGFPEHLRSAHGFVYRGNEYEQLQGFKERLLDEWPDAEVLTKLDTPGDDVIQSDGQYLQINAVEPVMGDKLKRLSGKPVAELILQYYKHNNVHKFVFNRPHHRPDEAMNGSNEDVSNQNEFATRWLERTELEISEKLPGILRWFPVVSQSVSWVSPLQAAVESLRETNRALKSLILDARPATAPLQPLTMRLNGILDPAVQGGIVNYERAFLTATYEARHPEHDALLAQLKDAIADQIPLLQFGLEVHGSRAPAALQALHAHLTDCFIRVQKHVHQKYGRKSYEFECKTPEVQLRINFRDSMSSQASHVTDAVNARVSDVSTGQESTSKTKFFNFNSARNSSVGVNVSSVFGTLQPSPKRRADKRRARKSEISSSSSQWYTSHATANGSAPTSAASSPAAGAMTAVSVTSVSSNSNDVTSPLRELRQQLVTERPLRAEVEKERRMSQRASLLNNSAPPSNRDSIGTTDSNQEEEEPPPLPQKSSHRSLEIDAENNNNPQESNALPVRHNYDTVFAPRGSFLYTSLAKKNAKTGGEKPPTPPPKKKNFLHS